MKKFKLNFKMLMGHNIKKGVPVYEYTKNVAAKNMTAAKAKAKNLSDCFQHVTVIGGV